MALRVAIVGSGPSGFYAAAQLIKQGAEVDVLERLPTPWGLVRGGVAPDHPKIKSVSRIYEKTAAEAGFRFFGNVEVGRDVAHDELLRWYDAVLYAVGTPAGRRAAIPGEGLPGSWSATDFVGWYNGHPDQRDLEFDLTARRAVVVGNGNVSVDVARMLTLSHDELCTTDIADHALEALQASQVEEIVMLGRRGPAQAAFTNPELLELGELAEADVIVDPADLQDAPPGDELDVTTRRNVEILREYAAREPAGKPRRVVLRFLTSPLAIEGAERVEAVRIGRNELVQEPGGAVRARPTGAEEVLDAGLVFWAIGYAGAPLPGVPFDERRCLFSNEGGRLVDGGAVVPGAYAAGWIKRGPSGVIGTNKKCAAETVAALLEDAEAGRLPRDGTLDADESAARLHERVPGLVGYAGWERIDRHERELGEPQSRPRVKLTRIAELLEQAAETAAAR